MDGRTATVFNSSGGGTSWRGGGGVGGEGVGGEMGEGFSDVGNEPCCVYYCIVDVRGKCVHIMSRESVDSLSRDGVDMPRLPYIGKACIFPNTASLGMYLIMVCE